MNATLIKKDDFLRNVIDALPTSIFVVGEDFQIFDINPAAANLFGMNNKVTMRRLCGEIMHCMHALESDHGCGTTAHCPDCVIRNSVESAFKGNAVHRIKSRMKIQKAKDMFDVFMLITASPFEYEDTQYALLAIEDITEITKLKRLLPICASCKKIRNDQNYWEAVSDYLNKHEDLEFTHSICPECTQKLYADLEF